MFGLAVIAALLNLMLLKFMTMNTEDENRDEIEALEAARLTVKLDGDVIMGEIVDNRRYASQPGLAGSVEDLRSVCSCNCLSCAPGFLTRYRPPARQLIRTAFPGIGRPVSLRRRYSTPTTTSPRPAPAPAPRTISAPTAASSPPPPQITSTPFYKGKSRLGSKFVWVKFYQFFFYQHHLLSHGLNL